VIAISTRDAASLLDIVHEGACADSHEAFPISVLTMLVALIPSDTFAGYDESEFAGGYRCVEDLRIVGQPIPASLLPVFRTFGWQDPLAGCRHARRERVVRLSDLVSRAQRRKLEYSRLVWEPFGIDDALRLWLPAPAKRARSIYLERSGKNYTDREKTLFSLLRPHFVKMRANAEFRRRMNGDRGLTPREAEVLGWVAHGKKDAEIARLLFISPHTVGKHMEHIFEKLGVRTRTAAAAYARGLTTQPLGSPAS